MGKEENGKTVKNLNKEYAARLWTLIRNQAERFTAAATPAVAPAALPPQKFKYQWVLNSLFVIPYLLAAVFLFSFFWDFEGISFSVAGKAFQMQGILRMLSISGLIGFLTNWVAITMLFKPTLKRPILGQGLIPAQKERIVFRLANAVAEDLINPELIKQKIRESQVIATYRERTTVYIKNIIDDADFRHELKTLVFNYVDEMIADPDVRAKIASSVLAQIDEAVADNFMEKYALKAYSFIKGQEMQNLIEEALQRLPQGVEKGLDRIDLFLDSLPQTLDRHSHHIEEVVTSLLYKLVNQLDVQALVEDNLRQYDEQKLEKLIKNASNEQLKYIQYLGAVLGTFGGFIIWEPVASLSVLLLIAIAGISIDTIIFRMRKKQNRSNQNSTQVNEN